MTEHLDFWLNNSFMKINKANPDLLAFYFLRVFFGCNYVKKKATVLGEKKTEPTTPGVPEWSPTSVLSGPDAA